MSPAKGAFGDLFEREVFEFEAQLFEAAFCGGFHIVDPLRWEPIGGARPRIHPYCTGICSGG